MDKQEQRRQHKEKAREQEKKEQKAHEEVEQKRRWPLHPAWVIIVGIVLTAAVVYVWTFRVW
jgi:hypothetical protein